MKYLIDTHVWLWAANEPETLSARARRIMQDPDEVFGVAAISLWEVAKKVEKGKLHLSRPVLEWIRAALPETVSIIALSPEIVVESMKLPGFHGDPADQLIVASARIHGLELITSDVAIRRAKLVDTLW